MHLQVLYEDRVGLARELLDLLQARNINLKGIESDPSDVIYLNFDDLDFETFRRLMAEIRSVHGVRDVKKINNMPSQQEKLMMWQMLQATTEALILLDHKGRVLLANPRARLLFPLLDEEKQNGSITSLLPDIDWHRYLQEQKPGSQRISAGNKAYQLQWFPAQEQGSNEPCRTIVVITPLTGNQISAHQAIPCDPEAFSRLVDISPAMQTLLRQARKMALLKAPLLITGDTGTGKDVLARACHHYSDRGDKLFLALNCAALPSEVMESELFGHAAGAYPNALEGKKGFFEQANGGSVLLDGVDEMSAGMQTKLLRFLNDGTFRRVGEEHEVHVDVRVICATQKNLLDLVNAGVFREDLYYRLNVLTLSLPPLRERKEDIFPLATQMLEEITAAQGLSYPRLSPDLKNGLCQYSWPGNVRQLKNVLYQALARMEGDELLPQHIPLPAEKGLLLTSSSEAL
ncbi:MAG: transcriptional regulator TyrR, partial [Enterobacteriaceae bacterium]